MMILGWNLADIAMTGFVATQALYTLSYASDLYLPAPLRDRLLASGPGALTEIATEAGVATAIVAGQYAHLEDAYPQMSKHRPRIADAELRALEAVDLTIS